MNSRTRLNSNQSTSKGLNHIYRYSTTKMCSFLKQIPLNQLLELQVVAATFLASMAPKVLGEFLRIEGPVRILDITYKYSRSDVPEHKALVYQCLLFLNRSLMLSKEVNLIMEAEK